MNPGKTLTQLRQGDLTSIANALRSKRLSPPFALSSVARIVGASTAQYVTTALQTISDRGCNAEALASCIDVLLESLATRPPLEDLVQLVMTGPVESGAYHRDTRVVVTDLFRRAGSSVTIAGYAVHQGKKIFEELALRMEAIPSLRVRLFLNLAIRPADIPFTSSAVTNFVQDFRIRHWPANHRLPEIYYDRRVLEAVAGSSIAFHAKCVVLDERELFVSSANFTEAAQNRNIELGVLLTSETLARQAEIFLSELVREGVCVRATM
ncbi:MAG TPA: DISARM system phospholipase D-like protein DrmC [Acidobacteriaceae bacterium]|nr:DISARM system phospholipase D-like protein DrmC [Acidobacteriaceae bacterium]